MDKSKFWLGGRLFNTASPRLGAPTQPKARPQDGRPNATQGTSASWAPQRNARHVRKLGAPTHVRNANARHATQGTSASWAPQRNASWAPQRTSATQTQDTQRKARPHVRKLGAPTQRKACPQDGRPNTKLIRNESVHTREHWAKSRAGGWIRTNFGLEVDFLIRPHGTSAAQVGRPNARPQRKRKARPQVGRPNARPQFGRHNATQGTSARWSPKRKTHQQRKRPHKGALG
jgi:hypothetical protein